MKTPKQIYYDKRGDLLVKNLRRRHFDAYYFENSAAALCQAIKLIPRGSTVAWGGALSARQIGLIDALCEGDYHAVPARNPTTEEEKNQYDRDCIFCDTFITGANGLSIDGQMVNIDGTGNRVAATIFGPKSVIVIAGMNKVQDTVEDALRRARTVAAPMNMQRFRKNAPCCSTGSCSNCSSEDCICNQIVITRNCRPAGRIKFILVGEDLGM